MRVGVLRRALGALLAAAGLAVAACSGSDPSPSASPDTTTMPAGWAQIEGELSRMRPQVGFLAARLSPDGACQPVHEVAASTARPIASQFKLFVLGALAEQVAGGDIAWDQELTVDAASRSLGNAPETGALQYAAPDAAVSFEEAATKMIAISDNTATDLLIALVGRGAVEEQVGRWTDHAALNRPFLTTRQMFLLHYAAGLGDRYLATPQEGRAAFLATEVDPLGLGEIAAGLTSEPRYVDRIEWFASPADVCRAFAGLRDQAEDPALSEALPTILSREVGGIGLDPGEWPTVWFKGGSEPGVLTLGWMATHRGGDSFVVEAMVSDPDAALAPEVIGDLVALAGEAFALLP